MSADPGSHDDDDDVLPGLVWDPATARARLLACAEADGDVAEGALWLAAEECGDVDPEPWLEALDELAQELQTRCGTVPQGPGAATAIPVVAALLRDRVRLHGTDGAHPRAHYLHTVLARGAGIPIACSTIWIAVGRRAGLAVEGVGLPGHFVVRVGASVVDAYAGGEILDSSGIRRVISRSLGTDPGEELPPEWLRRVSTREILARMSRNLRACHLARSDWRRALMAADRCVTLDPASPVERRERGVVLVRAGSPTRGLADLGAYLDAVPDASDRNVITRLMAEARAQAN